MVSNGVHTYLKAAEKIFSESEREDIVAMVAADPECGDVIQGTGGFARFESAGPELESGEARGWSTFCAMRSSRSF